MSAIHRAAFHFNDDAATVALRVKTVIDYLGITRVEIADRIGKGRQYVRKALNGAAPLTVAELCTVAGMCGLPPHAFLIPENAEFCRLVSEVAPKRRPRRRRKVKPSTQPR